MNNPKSKKTMLNIAREVEFKPVFLFNHCGPSNEFIPHFSLKYLRLFFLKKYEYQ